MGKPLKERRIISEVVLGAGFVYLIIRQIILSIIGGIVGFITLKWLNWLWEKWHKPKITSQEDLPDTPEHLHDRF